MRALFCCLFVVGLAFEGVVNANSVRPAPLDQRFAAAAAVCRGTVESITPYRGADRRIWTQCTLRVMETLKGRLPERVYVVHRGGQLDGEGESVSDSPRLQAGEDRLFFLQRREDGTVFIEDGPPGTTRLDSAFGRQILTAVRSIASADGDDLTDNRPSVVTRQPLVLGGLLEHTQTGRPYRFVAGDRGVPIPYIVDMDALPSGMSTNTALNAVSNAFKAWAETTSLEFEFAGVQSFGMPPGSASTNDGRIRVALHDLYNTISGSTTLGVGGAGFTFSESTGGDGGAVNGTKFHLSTRGQVVMKHTQPTLQNPVAFEEVLAHEIGHVLGMDHSSETQSEPDGAKADALMYFRVHDDGRGAMLTDLDKQVILTAYPTNNTPPVSFDRVVDVVSPVSGPDPIGNRVQLIGFDLQGTVLTPMVVSSSGATFSIAQGFLSIDFQNLVGDSERTDPLGNSAYARAKLALSDGTNDSPFFEVRVISISSDSRPTGNVDGLPDSWMVQYFGTADPSGNAQHAADADFDGDGINNLDEFRAGTDPTDAASALRITAGSPDTGLLFTARPGDLYQFDVTSDFVTWTNASLPFIATSTNVTLTNVSNVNGDHGFFRLRRMP